MWEITFSRQEFRDQLLRSYRENSDSHRDIRERFLGKNSDHLARSYRESKEKLGFSPGRPGNTLGTYLEKKEIKKDSSNLSYVQIDKKYLCGIGKPMMPAFIKTTQRDKQQKQQRTPILVEHKINFALFIKKHKQSQDTSVKN